MYIYSGGRVIGRVIGDVLEKNIRGSVHFNQKPPGIGCGLESLDSAEALGAKFVRVTEEETGKVYFADIALIRAKGVRIKRREYEPQLILPFHFWTDKKTAYVPPPPKPLVSQLGLW